MYKRQVLGNAVRRRGGRGPGERVPVACWPLGPGRCPSGGYVAAGGPGDAGVRRGYSGPGGAAHAVAVESRQQGGLIGDGQGQQLRRQIEIQRRVGDDADAVEVVEGHDDYLWGLRTRKK